MGIYEKTLINQRVEHIMWIVSGCSLRSMKAHGLKRRQSFAVTRAPVLSPAFLLRMLLIGVLLPVFCGRVLGAEIEATADTGNCRSTLSCPDQGGAGWEILRLQQRLAANPADVEARARLIDLLERTGAGGAAFDLPSGVPLRERTWWRDLVPMLQRTAWMALEVGHDSNINSGTADEVVHVPLLNYRSLTLDPLLTRMSSSFIGLRMGAVGRYPLGPRWALRAGGMAALRYNAAQYVYLPHSYEGRLALERDFGFWRLELGASGTQRWVAGYQAIGRSSVHAQLTGLFAHGLGGMAQVETSRNRYPLLSGAETKEDAMTLTLTHDDTGLRGSVMAARERATGVARELDHDSLGYSGAWVTDAFSRGRIRLTASETRARYLEPSPLFLTSRQDRTREYSIAYEHRLADGWTLTPRYVREENRSTVELMRYDRTQWMIEARKEF
jgi:hypothetical protein